MLRKGQLFIMRMPHYKAGTSSPSSEFVLVEYVFRLLALVTPASSNNPAQGQELCYLPQAVIKNSVELKK